MPAQQVPPRRECRRASQQERIDDAAPLPAWAQTLREVAQALFRPLVVELTNSCTSTMARKSACYMWEGYTTAHGQRLDT